MCVFFGTDTALSTCWTSVAQCRVSAQLCVSASFCPLCQRKEETQQPTERRWVSRHFYQALIFFMLYSFVISVASLAKHFLSQDWVTANGEKERGSKFNEALYSLLRFVSMELWKWQFVFNINGTQPIWQSQNLTARIFMVKASKVFPSFL